MSSREAPRGAYFTAPEGTRCSWIIPGVRANVTYAIDRKVFWSGKNDPVGEEQYRRRYHGGQPMAAGERRADGADVETELTWQFHLIDSGPIGDRTAEIGYPHRQDVLDWAAYRFPSIGIPIPKEPTPPVAPPAQPSAPTPATPPPAGKVLSPIPQRLEELRIILKGMAEAAPFLVPTIVQIPWRWVMDDRYWPYTKQLLGPALEMWRAIKAKAERP